MIYTHVEKCLSFAHGFQPQQMRSHAGLGEFSTESTGPTTTNLDI